MMGPPTLSYFELRGRAEASRLLLGDLGVEFIDRRVTSPEEWAALKREVPFASLPRYQDDRVDLTQSHAILRYLARTHGLVGVDGGGDAAGWAVYDEIQEVLSEAQEHLWRFAWEADYQSKKQRYADGILRWFLGTLQRWYSAHGAGEYWVGDTVSHIDYLAFTYLDEVRAFFPETLAGAELLATFHARMQARPRIAEYIDSGRRPVVFGMAVDGPKVDPDVVLSPGEMFHNPWREPIELELARSS
jgi:glutathione S-transferase